jgi:hypothetical protein
VGPKRVDWEYWESPTNVKQGGTPEVVKPLPYLSFYAVCAADPYRPGFRPLTLQLPLCQELCQPPLLYLCSVFETPIPLLHTLCSASPPWS